MGIVRIPFNKDCFITSESISGNSGRDQVVNVAGKYVELTQEKFISRILGSIDTSSTSDLVTKINDGYIPDPNTNTTVTAYLKMFNTLHSERKAVGFNINVFPLTSDWDEGTGIGFNESNDLLSTGYANYIYRKPSLLWSNSGGDYKVDSNSSSQYFSSGDENLNVNVTNIIKVWLNSTSSNYGFIIKMGDFEESLTGTTSASLDYYRKSFFARETNFLKWPRVEFVWNDRIIDYKSIAPFGTSSYLYFYNISNGTYKDLSGTGAFPGHVVIEGITSNSSTSWSSVSSSLSSVTASRISTGIYRMLINELPYSIYSTYSKFRDNWTITSSISSVLSSLTSFITTISPINNSFDNVDYSKLTVNFLNFQNEYLKENKITFRIFIKDLSYSYQTLTASSTSFSNLIIEDGYWRILTDKDEIDIDWQSLSFDKNGNFFVLDMNNFIRNTNYKIDLKLNYKNQNLFFDGKEISAVFRVI